MITPSDYHSTHHSSPNNILKRHIDTAARQVPAHRPRILIVEDHAETGLLMQYALRRHYRTEVVPAAKQALQKAAAATYDGFLIDICLRLQGNGIDVLETLRADEQYRHAPMVAVTAHALPGDCERFLAAGFDGYISKPFATDDLRAAMRRHVPPHHTQHRTPAIDNVSTES